MRIFSGIRPTGDLHIGNYLGAIQQWLKLQKDNECIFCIVDLHAITTPYNPKKLQKNILEVTATYLATGLNPSKSIIFVQSKVKEHSELAWLLGTITPVGELQRMTQYKEKTKKHQKHINAGLLNYPILMAADILLYQTDVVPVGRDQQQHVELTKTIAKKFNSQFGETFKIPKILLSKEGAKIMSLQNPRKKMSKTDQTNSWISLFDKPEIIKQKIMKATTDTGKKIIYSPQKKPGISNLLSIYSLFSKKPIKVLEKDFKNKGYVKLKKALINLLIDSLKPFRRKQKELLSREVYIEEILGQGKRKAELIAQSTLQEAKKKMGLA